MLGTWMAQTGVKSMIIDKKSCRTQVGHADGIESRTLEILDSFGVGETIWKDANKTVELCLWVSNSLFLHLATSHERPYYLNHQVLPVTHYMYRTRQLPVALSAAKCLITAIRDFRYTKKRL